MQYTHRQKAVIENIVTIHETGKLSASSYSQVTNARGDPGGLTYGKHQVTINSGGLYLMLKRYCDAPGARFANELRTWVEGPVRQKLQNVASSPALRDLLSKAGADPVMARVQDSYFDDQYWNPAVKFCDAKGLARALALAVVYDSTIHGSLYRIDKRLPKGLNTAQWIGAYVEARRSWMQTHSILILRRCVYRMDTFAALLRANNFDLVTPVIAHGRRADVGLEGSTPQLEPMQQQQQPPIPVGTTTQRILDRGDKGVDVAELQNMLLRLQYNIGAADGIFGGKTEVAIKALQSMYGLKADGIVGPSTWRLIDQLDD